MDKPITVAMEDATKEIVESINKIANDNHLSFYFLEMILEKIYTEVKYKSNEQRQQDRLEYEKQKNRKEEK